ncbi:MAG: hypothetical protein AAF404_21220, partial [Pseudomonadota bacterium]
RGMDASKHAIELMTEARVNWDAPRQLLIKSLLAIDLGENTVAQDTLEQARSLAGQYNMLDYELSAVVQLLQLFNSQHNKAEAFRLYQQYPLLNGDDKPPQHLAHLAQRAQALMQ